MNNRESLGLNSRQGMRNRTNHFLPKWRHCMDGSYNFHQVVIPTKKGEIDIF